MKPIAGGGALSATTNRSGPGSRAATAAAQSGVSNRAQSSTMTSLQMGYWSDDSDDDGLGSVSRISRDEIFSFQVARDENGSPFIKIGSSASGARHSGNRNINGEGDHVNAYVLLLQSIACCKNQKIKQLPDIFYQVAVSILPQQVQFFREQHVLFKLESNNMRRARKEATANLRSNDSAVLKNAKNNLIFAEFEAIARHIERVGNAFVGYANAEENAAFQKKYYSKKICVPGRKDQKLPDITIDQTSNREMHGIARLISFDQMLGDFSTGVTFDNLRESHISGNQIGSDLVHFFDVTKTSQVPASGYKNHTNQHLNWLLSKITQFENKTLDVEEKQFMLCRVAEFASDLYDYIATGVTELDNRDVLYETLSKHIKLIFAALPNLQKLPQNEQEQIYLGIVDNVLSRQGWDKQAEIKHNLNPGEKINREEFLENMKTIEQIQEAKVKASEIAIDQRYLLRRHGAEVGFFSDVETSKRKQIEREFESENVLLQQVALALFPGT